MISIYEYRSNEIMENFASKINSDGSQIGDALVDWIGPPHFYKKGNILVQYVGENKEIIKVLEKILGKQFAGIKI